MLQPTPPSPDPQIENGLPQGRGGSCAAEVRLWSRTRVLTAVLLLLWLAISIAGPWFARDLNRLQLFGFPAGYWLAAQGSLLAFLVIVLLCVWYMERLEARYEAELAARAAAPAEPEQP